MMAAQGLAGRGKTMWSVRLRLAEAKGRVSINLISGTSQDSRRVKEAVMFFACHGAGRRHCRAKTERLRLAYAGLDNGDLECHGTANRGWAGLAVFNVAVRGGRR